MSEKNYVRKLDKRAVIHIRTLVKEGKTLDYIRTYLKDTINISISRESIRCAANGKTWGWLLDPPPLPVVYKKRGGNKVSSEQAIEIRRKARETALRSREIAKEYNVQPGTITNIINGRTFQHINDESPPVYRYNSFRRKKNVHHQYRVFRRLTPEHIDTIRTMFNEEGKSVKEIWAHMQQVEDFTAGLHSVYLCATHRTYAQ